LGISQLQTVRFEIEKLLPAKVAKTKPLRTQRKNIAELCSALTAEAAVPTWVVVLLTVLLKAES
jgi:hypothetical protein